MSVAVLVLIVACALVPLFARLRASLLAFRRLVSNAQAVKDCSESTRSNAAVQLAILLPCLNEQSIVDETLTYFAEMASNFRCSVTLVPITGESELTVRRHQIRQIDEISSRWWLSLSYTDFVRSNRGVFPLRCFNDIRCLRGESRDLLAFRDRLLRFHSSLPTTWDLIQAWKDANPDKADLLYCIHEPKTNGSKASKLNFAADLLVNSCNKIVGEKVYFGVYDFDSRPSKETFQWLLDVLSDPAVNPAPVYQQVPHQLGTEIDIKLPVSHSRLSALWHLERTLGIETRELYAWPDHREHWQVLRGSMGAGLFIDADVLPIVDGFPDYSDDVALGYRLDLLRIRRELIPFPNFVQPAPTALSIYKQYRRIWPGILSKAREFEHLRSHQHDLPPYGARFRIFRTYIQDFTPSIQLGALALAVLYAYFQLGWAIAVVTFITCYLCYAATISCYIRMAGVLRERFYQPLVMRHSLLTVVLGAFYGGYIILGTFLYYSFKIWTTNADASQIALEKTER